jgi:glycolate oxidase FAD binding subunit
MTLAGLTAREAIEPHTITDLAICVDDLYARDIPYAFIGGGSHQELGNLPRALDTLVRTTGCNRVIDYAPQDQTITVEGGMTIGAVNAVLANERQFLAIDAPEPLRTTIGGAVATNVYGRRRLRYGSIKDMIVGIEIVRPDGIRARGGGKVVKNVAGFDIPKLMVGSLGTLGAVVSATFRVYPIEEERAAVVYHGVTIEQMMQMCDALVSASLVPAAVVAFECESAHRYDCCVTFEGFAFGVEQQVKAATSIAFKQHLNAGAYAVPFTASFDERERAVRTTAPWRLTFSAKPTVLARFLTAVDLPAGARCALYPMLGVAFVAADDLDPGTIGRWRQMLDGGSIVAAAMPREARATLDAWGDPPPSALAIMRRLKAQFDPKGLCNPGRFVGGI